MVMENLAVNNRLVNGVEGVVQEVDYGIDNQNRHYAKTCYVLVKGLGLQLDCYERDVMPILPGFHSFMYTNQF